jgi:hypothetical protein
MGIFARHEGEWYRVDGEHGGPIGGDGAPGAAVIGDATGAVTTSSFTGDGTNGDDGQAYDVYEFTGSGELIVSEPGLVEALVVGGGGGGGASGGGGGGAGGHVYNTSFYLPDATHTVTIGGGGAGGIQDGDHAGMDGQTGNTTGIESLLYSPGGGGGGCRVNATAERGHNGASGGGGGGASGSGREWGTGGKGFSPIGNDGGTGNSSSAAGGGGAGSAGGVPTAGTGAPNSITGASVTRAAGGTGYQATAANGTDNTGNGGGGRSGGSGSGGSGGSGIVIVRVKVPTESYPFRTRTTAPRTAHAARIEDGIVRQVIVIPHLDDDDNKITEYCNKIGLPGTWVDTSYTGARRGKYAGVGDLFDLNARNAEFVSPVVDEEQI